MLLQNKSSASLVSNYPSSLSSRQLILKVKDIMTELSDVVFVEGTCSCMDAIPLLNKSGRGFVLVNDSNKTANVATIGVFTDGDLRRAVAASGYDALEKKVHHFASRHPRHVHQDQPAFSAMQLMCETKTVSFLLVVCENEVVVGVVSRHQILDAQLLAN